MADEKTGVDRVEDFVRNWTNYFENVIKKEYHDIALVQGMGLDWRDLMQTVAAARGAEKNSEAFIQLSEVAVQGWRHSNRRQQEMLSRLLNEIVELRRICAKYQDDDERIKSFRKDILAVLDK